MKQFSPGEVVLSADGGVVVAGLLIGRWSQPLAKDYKFTCNHAGIIGITAKSKSGLRAEIQTLVNNFGIWDIISKANAAARFAART